MKTMFDMIQAFPDQLAEAMDIGANAIIRNHQVPIHKVFVSGMGGSGIGADFVSSFIRNTCKVPYLVGKSYDMPAFIDQHTLVIISSYSGNTEETLSTFRQLISSNAKIVCIASGGEVIKIAKESNFDVVQLPNNWPSPRACLGFSLVSQLYVISKLELVDPFFIPQLNDTILRLKNETSEILEKAKQLAAVLNGKLPVIYSTDRIEPVAIRFRQQINENSKMLCWHHVIPEMNHNELVGWRWNQDAIAVVFLRNSDDHERNQARIELTKEIVSHYTTTVVELYSKGNSLIERSFYLVHLLDYVSVFLADYNKVDAIEVRVIDFLKSELSKI
ncbi:MAG: bifunctional phosphoglucose/phosphomannose isomerase [Saprospiraceae bacterium]|nr:bifunctional phosphoglucose/phosphomannose isomerase [Saprospiraceae bacterium]MBK9220877.1 bifunctional phosphoglucose/phosphomannose isomerase [Saprospiraceae bacterium]MBK9722278.1 bifunctional phosphoglucose/phosphomannose isomerase [Saprospiraceae bacterium]